MYVIKKVIDDKKYSVFNLTLKAGGGVEITWTTSIENRLVLKDRYIAQSVLELIDDSEAMIFKTN